MTWQTTSFAVLFCSNSTFSENAVVSSVIECGCHSINNCNVCECNRIKYLGWIPFLCLTPSPLGFEGQGLGVKTYPYEMRRHLVTVTSSYIVASCCYITRGHKCWSQTCRLKCVFVDCVGFSDVFLYSEKRRTVVANQQCNVSVEK